MRYITLILGNQLKLCNGLCNVLGDFRVSPVGFAASLARPALLSLAPLFLGPFLFFVGGPFFVRGGLFFFFWGGGGVPSMTALSVP